MCDDWKRPVKIVAVKDAQVRNPEWREELKAWADKMEGRFGEEETPVGPIVTREWIRYVEELESQNEELRELVEEWRELNKRLGEKADELDHDPTPFCRSRAVCADELEEVLEDE